jgi:hypothetical protein
MRTEYGVTTASPSTVTSPQRTSSLRKFGLACAASGLIGIVIGIVTLSYPAAVTTKQWSYPFSATAQWITSSILSVTHLLTLAGLVGVAIVAPYGASRSARRWLQVAMVGYAALAACEILSGSVGTRSNSSSYAGFVGGCFGVASLIVAIGSIFAGVLIIRRTGQRFDGWSMVLWSGVVLLVLVTPASIIGNEPLVTATLILLSLTLIPLGAALLRAAASDRATQGPARETANRGAQSCAN